MPKKVFKTDKERFIAAVKNSFETYMDLIELWQDDETDLSCELNSEIHGCKIKIDGWDLCQNV